MRRKQEVILVGIFALGLILRCIAISNRGIQYDDAFSILMARQSLAAIVRGTAADTMPPLYYFLLHFWLLGGQSVWFLRLLGVLFSTGCIGLSYLIARDLLGLRAAWIAAFLVAISPLQIYHAQDIRMYSLLAFCQSGYLWFFVRLWLGNKHDWLRWGGLILLGTAAIYTHNLAIFVLIVPNLFLLWKRNWSLFFQLLLAQLVIGLLFLPWIFFVPGQIHKIQQAFWTPRPGLIEIIQSLIILVANLPLPQGWLAIVTIIAVQIVVIVLVEVWRRNKNDALKFVITCWVLPPVLLFLTSYLMRPVFVPRGFITSMLFFLIMAGWVIAQIFPKSIGWFLAIGFILASAITLPYQYTYNRFPRSPYKEAMQSLAGVVGSDDLILHDNKLSYFPSFYYAPNLPQSFLADEKGSINDTLAIETQEALGIFAQPNLQAAIQGYSEVYFVVFTQAMIEYRSLEQGKHPHLQWLEQNFFLVERRSWQDLEVYHFRRREG